MGRTQVGDTTSSAKACTRCGETKPLTEFYKTINRHGKPWTYSRCKECQREQMREIHRRDPSKAAQRYKQRRARLRRARLTAEERALESKRQVDRVRARAHGLIPEQLEAMLEGQGGRCAICGRLPGKRRLAIDHDHETNQVRELLCGPCNQGLGFFGDDPDLLMKAASYLRKHHQQRLRIIK